ncbi:hypothetical protein MNBD_GAMMA24-1679 [hydrothermal vent metagenome]|uniref:Intracellular sulfur oxidation DsrE/DsrF family protein n=1 Tax=hydrothermal vent metagenome TaxID=652676 RepID=A0A3B1BEA7_9ZZZZ
MSTDFSDERLNAFIDNEMDLAEKQETFEVFRHDEALRKRACELQKTHDLIKLTYQSVDLPPSYQTPLRNKQTHPRFLRNMVAATILVVVSSLLGWFGHQELAPNNSLLDLARAVQPPQAVNSRARKIMLHVSTSDEYRLNIMLTETEHLLKASRKNGEKVFVEILANGPGLKIVDNVGSAPARRLQKLQTRYDNLYVTACAQAIERLRVTKGIKLDLIPNASVVRSSLSEVLKRQREGWTYIRI